MSRDVFLKRVREAAHAGRAYRVAPRGVVTETTGYVGGGDDVCATFVAELTAVGGFAHPVETLDAARQALRQLLERIQAKSALCWRHDVLDRLKLAPLLADLNITQVNFENLRSLPPDEQRARALAPDVGITSCDYAIAETGTLAMFTGNGQERMASLLPPVHVAIVERRQIVPDLFDLFRALNEAGNQQLASNIALITGPSKTGDIELQLTTGVHGPGELHVILNDCVKQSDCHVETAE